MMLAGSEDPALHDWGNRNVPAAHDGATTTG
jgi:hypothetical protein